MRSERDKLKRRVRKTVKWGGAVLSVLLLVVWIGSAWIEITRMDGSSRCDIVRNGYFRTVSLDGLPPISRTHWKWGKCPEVRIEGGFKWDRGGPIKTVTVPLWPAALLSLLATAAAWRADAKYLRRVRTGLCARCGYDRAGLAAGSLCPECGKQPEAR